MSSWQPGQLLQEGKYIIEEVLGSGGFGVTYLAREKLSDKLVAIKTLNTLLQKQPDFAKHQERFVKEAFFLAKCSHPQIVRVDNVCQEGKLWCMVMEYIDGINLQEYVKNKGILPELEARLYIEQIGEALTYIHQQGLLHRDVKPANIMLRRNTVDTVLIDFGSARKFITGKSQTHTITLSEHFAPMEQYQRAAKRGAYTDVYALAATLYYLLTAQFPESAYLRQQMDTLIPPQQYNPKISDRISNAIFKGMELLPENRPSSVQEWLNLLYRTGADFSKSTFDRSQVARAAKDCLAVGDTSSPQNEDKERKKKNLDSLPLQLESAVGVDYTRLKELLVARKWKEADRETYKLMLRIAGREKQRHLEQEAIANFPSEDLRTIDQLWLEFSQRRFGFSVQKRIWQKVGGRVNYETECLLGHSVGWFVNGKWLHYHKLKFSLDAPVGHLPLILVYWGWGYGTLLGNLLSRRDL